MGVTGRVHVELTGGSDADRADVSRIFRAALRENGFAVYDPPPARPRLRLVASGEPEAES